MQEQPINLTKSGIQLERSFVSVKDVSLSFLLFCSVVYSLSALQGLFPSTPTFAMIGVLLVLIALVSLRAVIRMQIASNQLSRVGTAFLFLSFLAWVSRIGGGLAIIFSLLCLALCVGLYLACALRELEHVKGDSFFTRIFMLVVGLLVMTGLFLLLRWMVGWFLAQRLMLLVPAAALLVELRKKERVNPGSQIGLRGHLKKEWLTMASYGLLFAGFALLLFNLVGSFLQLLAGLYAFQALLFAVFLAAIFLLAPLRKRCSHYLLSATTMLVLLVSVVLYADSQPSMAVWLVLTLLTGAALGGAGLSLKASCSTHQGASRLRLFYVAVTVALAVVSAYPLCLYFLGAGASLLLAPFILFAGLVASFFVGHHR